MIGDGVNGEPMDLATRYAGTCDDSGLDLIVRLKPHQGGQHAGLLQIQLHQDGTYTLDTTMVLCRCCRERFEKLLE